MSQLVKLRFVDYVVDSRGEPMPHPTKPGQLARNGGQIPLIDPETKLPRCMLPGDVFEVEKVIADDLLSTHAQTGLVVLESEYQKRKFRADTAKAEDDADRHALAGVYQSQAAQKVAARRLAAQLRRQQAADLAEHLAPVAAPAAIDVAAIVAREVEKVRAEAAAELAALKEELAAQKVPAAPTPVVTEGPKPTEQPEAKEGGGKDERKKGGK